jgi:hypothetical protein
MDNLSSEYSNADHDGMKDKTKRQIGDDPDRDRDQVITATADRDRRRAGIGAVL